MNNTIIKLGYPSWFKKCINILGSLQQFPTAVSTLLKDKIHNLKANESRTTGIRHLILSFWMASDT